MALGEETHVSGIVLAAGAGSRAGGPKALRRTAAGRPWIECATSALLEAGCSSVIVVLGAAAEQSRALVPTDARISTIDAHDWADGMSASLRVGLEAAEATAAVAALVSLVDLPELPTAVARRVLGSEATAVSLRQATFGGRPGHPVLLGREHWPSIAASLAGDRGARDYLRAHDAESVECGDLWDGLDRDRG